MIALIYSFSLKWESERKRERERDSERGRERDRDLCSSWCKIKSNTSNALTSIDNYCYNNLFALSKAVLLSERLT